MFKFMKKEKWSDMKPEKNCIYAPVRGEAIPLSKVKDDIFSQGMLGKGIAIKPADNTFYAPVSGTVVVAPKSCHAVAITTQDGLDILIHVGIDTVELNGTHFKSFVKEGETVKAGQKIITFDRQKVEESGYDTTTMIVVTNTDNYEKVEPKILGDINEMDKVIELV